MKPKTRDNLIYLAVGIIVAAFAVADSFYEDKHHTKGWILSRFVVRAVTTPSLLAYFVVREMCRQKATFLQTLSSVLFATLIQIGLLFGFRQTVDQLPGIGYAALAGLEIFFVWQLTILVARYMRSD